MVNLTMMSVLLGFFFLSDGKTMTFNQLHSSQTQTGVRKQEMNMLKTALFI